MNYTNYTWNGPFKLIDVTEDQRMVYLHTDKGRRQMSKGKYGNMAQQKLVKARGLIGTNIRIRTSQNTAKWAPETWFSDVEPYLESIHG